MKIQVGGLSEGIHEYSFEASSEELGLPPEFQDAVNVEATLEKTGSEMLLRAVVKTKAEFSCDRCVSPIRQELASQYQMYYAWEGSDTARFDPAELQLIPAGQTIIDLAEDVRQTILLAVPLKHLCREECKGLCPHCGKNLNEGPCTCTESIADGRWDKLKELQNNNTNDG